MEPRKQNDDQGIDDSVERNTRYEEARAHRIKQEVKQRKQDAKEKRWEWARATFSQATMKQKLALIIGPTAVLAFVFGCVLPLATDNRETQYLAESDLKSVVNIDDLSTVNYVYHGIAEKHEKLFWQDMVSYRVKYEAHVRSTYKLSNIEFTVDEDEKIVTAYLPKAEIGKPEIKPDEYGYLPESAKADMKEVIDLCRQDAKSDINKSDFEKEANLSLEHTVQALTMPLLGNDYELEFRPLSEFNDVEDNDVAE